MIFLISSCTSCLPDFFKISEKKASISRPMAKQLYSCFSFSIFTVRSAFLVSNSCNRFCVLSVMIPASNAFKRLSMAAFTPFRSSFK